MDDELQNSKKNLDLIGGELITPTAVKIGETTETAVQRGFFEGIKNAYQNPDNPQIVKIKNIQEIVDAAEAYGVSRDQIGNYLTSLGINAIRREDIPQTTENKSSPEPLKLEQIKENPNLEKRKIDNNSISLKQRNGVVIVFHNGTEAYQVPGTFKEVTINGSTKKFILTETTPDMAYIPFMDSYLINPQNLDTLKNNPEIFASSLLHELGHEAYFSLNETDQRNLNDLFLKNTDLQNILLKFGKAIYTDKLSNGFDGGANYLQTHDINQIQKDNVLVCPDNQKGIKDNRTLVTEVNGTKKEVSLSLLITELISYTSSLQIGKEVFSKVSTIGKSRRGGVDSRYDIILEVFSKIQNDPNLKSAFEKFQIFKDNTPSFTSEISQIL